MEKQKQLIHRVLGVRTQFQELLSYRNCLLWALYSHSSTLTTFCQWTFEIHLAECVPLSSDLIVFLVQSYELL